MASSESSFHGRRKDTIAVQIHRRLYDRIVSGELMPRQSLPENELAASLGVSRTPVREALSKLEEEGLVQILPQYGTFVAPIVPEGVFGNQFVREALECAVIGTAATNCTEDDAARLRAILHRQQVAESDAEFVAADDALHCLLMAIGGQEHAWEVVRSAKLHLDRVRHLSARNASKREAVIKEHVAIIDCVIAGDSHGAIATMREHLRGVYTSIKAAMRTCPQYFTDVTETPTPLRQRAKVLPTIR